MSLKDTGLHRLLMPSMFEYDTRESIRFDFDDNWARLESALRGLSALEAIDLSGGGHYGGQYVSQTLALGRLVMCCAGEAFACVA